MAYAYSIHVIVFFWHLISAALIANLPSAQTLTQNVIAKEGETAILPCRGPNETKHDRKIQVVWMDRFSVLLTYNDRRIIDDRRFSIERPTYQDWNLHVRDVRRSDQGIYECNIKTTSRVTAKRVNLLLQAPARILDELSSSEVAVREGDTATLVCNVTGTPHPNVTWYLISHENRRSERRTEAWCSRLKGVDTKVEVLSIHNVTRDCAGDYECVADNGISQRVNRTIQVSVQYTPQIDKLNIRGQYKGEEMVLECSVNANPLALLRWFKDGQEISSSHKYKLVTYEEGKDQIYSSLVVSNIQDSDYGDYTCEAINLLGRAEETVTLHDLMPRESQSVFDQLQENVTVKVTAGSTAILPCSFGSFSKYEVIWMDVSEPDPLSVGNHVYISDTRFSIERPNASHWNLHIQDVSVEDQGDYLCRTTSKPVKAKAIHLQVQVPARILDHLSSTDVTVNEGDNVTLICNVTGTPRPNVTWHMTSAKPGTHDHKLVTSCLGSEDIMGEVIVIHNATRKCSGLYECVANNGIEPMARRRIQILVHYAPEIYKLTTEVGRDIGEGAVLECMVTGFPLSYTYWMKDGQEISSLHKKYRMDIYEVGMDQLEFSLKVFNIQDSDYGSYTCVAVNFLGQAKETITLYDPTPRTSGPTFDQLQENVTVRVTEGSTAILPCSFSSLGKHQVVWTDVSDPNPLSIGSYVYTSDTRFSIERPDASHWNLQIQDVSVGDQGGYLCRTTSKPVRTKTVHLQVQVPARILDHLSSTDVTVDEGDNVTLICNVTGTPHPNVTWHMTSANSGAYDQKLETSCLGSEDFMGEILVIRNVTRNCSGTYKCVANNGIEPVVSRRILVFVQFAPDIYRPTARIGQKKGEEAVLECFVNGFPWIETSWRKNGRWIFSTHDKYRVDTFAEGRDQIRFTLVVSNIQDSDYGPYTCVANNFMGRAQENITLYDPTPRTSDPTFDQLQENVTVRVTEGSTVILPCSFSSVGKHQVVWMGNSMATPLSIGNYIYVNNMRLSIKRPNASHWNLQIQDVSVEDQGDYHCQTTSKPVKTRTVHLQVQVPARILYELSTTNVTVKEGDTITLVCNVTGTPHPNVTWNLNCGYHRVFNVTTETSCPRSKDVMGEVMVIRNVTRYCAGIYECVADNGIKQAASNRIEVLVHYAPEIYMPQTRIGQKRGKGVVLECKVTGFPQSYAIWMKDGQEISSSHDKYRVAVHQEGKEKISSRLVVSNIQDSDYGPYTCIATNFLGRAEDTVTLYDLMPRAPDPTFDQLQENVTVRVTEGSTAVLPCSFGSLGKHQVIWVDVSEPYPLSIGSYIFTNDTRFSIEKPDASHWNLQIQDVSVEDQGDYLCRTTSKPVRTKTVHLQVQDLTPTATDSTFDQLPESITVTVTEGSTAILPCSFGSLGKHKVIWRDVSELHPLSIGNYIFASDSRLSIERSNASQWNLLIRDVKFDDQGDYLCQATTKPVKTKTVHLQVQDLTPRAFENVTVTVTEGSTAILPCSFDSLGKHKVVWMDEAEPDPLSIGNYVFTSDTRFSIQRPDASHWNLQIQDVSIGDQGGYLCRTTSKPVRIKTVHLQVQVPARILDELSSTDITVNEGGTITLICYVTGTPHPNVKWFLNSLDIKEFEQMTMCPTPESTEVRNEVLVIHNVTHDCAGAYKCVADNGISQEVHRMIQVSVQSTPKRYVASERIGQEKEDENFLECIMTDFPIEETMWMKFGLDISSSRIRNRLNMQRVRGNQTRVNLRQLNIHDSDKRVYTCLAYYNLSHVEQAIFLYDFTNNWEKSEASLLSHSVLVFVSLVFLQFLTLAVCC